jgi:hypothetical protein
MDLVDGGFTDAGEVPDSWRMHTTINGAFSNDPDWVAKNGADFKDSH